MNILIVGVGGQGIILASDIVTLAAMYNGYDAKKSEIHGMSQRGGSVFSHIRYGEKIYSPVINEGEVDILLSLEDMETLRWLNYLNNESKILFTNTQILPANIKEYPEGIYDELKLNFKNLISINSNELLQKIGKPKYINVSYLGLLSNFLDISLESWRKSIFDEVPKGTFEENWNAFEIGKNFNYESGV